MGKFSQEKKKSLNENKRQFFLSFFDEEEGYEEREINGWWLVKSWDGNRSLWHVSLYSQESLDNLKRGQDKFTENQGSLLDDAFFRAIEKE